MGLFDAGARRDRSATVHDRVVSVPNAVTLLRLMGLPVFAWLVLGAGRLDAAFWVLTLIAATDWVDGFLARRLDQVTRLGAVIDPLIDRALLATAAVVLLLAGIVDWWLVALVVGRDVVLVGASFALFGAVPPIPVNRAGKVATAGLLAAFPSFLLGAFPWAGQDAFAGLAWALALVGVVCYYVAGIGYALAAWRWRRERREAADGAAARASD